MGFVGLCLNAPLPEPSLAAIYLLGIWDGALRLVGVTALLAATPALVGRENLMQAGAITMLTVRLGSVISPMIGGLLPTPGGVAWNSPGGGGDLYHHLNPAASAAAAAASGAGARASAALPCWRLTFLCRSPLIGGIALLGGLLDHGQRGAGARIRRWPELAGCSAGQIGLLYAAIPLGAWRWGVDQRPTGPDGAAGRAGCWRPRWDRLSPLRCSA